MIYSAQILIQSQISLESLADELQALLDTNWTPAVSWNKPSYESLLGRTLFTLSQHNYVNDVDVNFEDYPYALELETRHIITEEDLDHWFHKTVRPTYEKLKGQRKYCLMLVQELQLKLDEYCPERS